MSVFVCKRHFWWRHLHVTMLQGCTKFSNGLVQWSIRMICAKNYESQVRRQSYCNNNQQLTLFWVILYKPCLISNMYICYRRCTFTFKNTIQRYWWLSHLYTGLVKIALLADLALLTGLLSHLQWVLMMIIIIIIISLFRIKQHNHQIEHWTNVTERHMRKLNKT